MADENVEFGKAIDGLLLYLDVRRTSWKKGVIVRNISETPSSRGYFAKYDAKGLAEFGWMPSWEDINADDWVVL